MKSYLAKTSLANSDCDVPGITEVYTVYMHMYRVHGLVKMVTVY